MKTALPLLTTLLLLSPAARAEDTPDLEKLSSQSALILHCRTAKNGEEVRYKIENVLKGQYNPLDFRSPETDNISTGFITPPRNTDQAYLIPRRHVILFYAEKQPQGGYGNPTLMLTTDDQGKLPAPRGNAKVTVAEFLSQIRLLPGTHQVEKPAAASAQHVDLSGEWRLLLPAGFEHKVTLTAVDNVGYRLTGPKGSAFNAVYGWEDGQLRWIGDKVPNGANIPALMKEADGYIWKVHGPYMLTLTYDHHRNGGHYLGAVLFRAKPEGESKKKRPIQIPLER